jgi:hypothetical protein
VTGPVEEHRWCEWERLMLPVDHDCIADGAETADPPEPADDTA